MASNRSPPRDVFRKWSEIVVPVEDARASGLRRARIIASTALAISREAEKRARRRRLVGRGIAWASAACVLLGLAGAWRSRARSAVPSAGVEVARVHVVAGSLRATHAGGVPAVSPSGRDDVTLAAGDDVTTEPGSQGLITLLDGVALSLEGASRLHLPEPRPPIGDEQVRFDVGVVHVRVPHLPAGRTFSIKTPDAEVRVHGTAFTVEVGSPSAAPLETRVSVSEGIVSVSSGGVETRLTAGMRWSTPRPEPEPVANASPPAGELAPDAPPTGSAALRPLRGVNSAAAAEERGPHRTVRAGSAEVVTSSLAEQNHLLAAALEAARGGDDRRAIDSLNELLRRFPSSTLAQEGRVQRFRALERLGNHEAAAREARAYLAAYPDGSARDEASSLALKP